MIEGIKNWINSILCMGIFVLLIQLIIPKTNLKKYIYSLIGIMLMLSIISPVMNLLKNENVEASLNEIITQISNTDQKISTGELENLQYEAIKVGFMETLQADVEKKLMDKGIKVEEVNIVLDTEYNIQQINITLGENLIEKGTLIQWISTEYDISKDKIQIDSKGEKK